MGETKEGEMKKFTIMVISSIILINLTTSCGVYYRKKIQERRTSYVQNHPELDERTKSAILNGRIFIGMNTEQVLASWGKPNKINRSVYEWGVHEQWVYGGLSGYGRYSSYTEPTYLYFEDGLLKSWQD